MSAGQSDVDVNSRNEAHARQEKSRAVSSRTKPLEAYLAVAHLHEVDATERAFPTGGQVGFRLWAREQ
jgi:hypothetical protein